MELRNMAIGRALAWERTPEGVRFRCVAGGLVAANVTVTRSRPHHPGSRDPWYLAADKGL